MDDAAVDLSIDDQRVHLVAAIVDGNVLQDQVSQGSSYSSPNTWTENHGSVLLDEVADNRGSTSDIEVGDSESGLFETDAESAF